MSNEEFMKRLSFLANNPESVSIETLEYIVCLLKSGVIEAYWDGKVSCETMYRICIDEEN